MFLHSKLNNNTKVIRIGIIGCGKFISMFLAQYPFLKNIEVDSIVDKNITRAKKNCIKSGINKETLNKILFFNKIEELLDRNLDVVIEATGNAINGVKHAIKCIKNKFNVIMVNVEADALCGKYLGDLAKKNSTIYSLAYGDQPSLIIEQIEWALSNGFEVISAGKGTKYLPEFEYSTPKTVWSYYGLNEKQAISSGMNAKMFNSFITGDKSSIEMASVINSTSLICSSQGLNYPSVSIPDLPNKLIPFEDGGVLEKKNMVEVITSLRSNKSSFKNNLRWGVFIIISSKNKYVQKCFKEYGMITDRSGKYTALWRPYHYIGMELATSIYSVILNKLPTGSTKYYKCDVVAVAKKNISKGEYLDGEGGYTVRGKLVNSKFSIKNNLLPIGLADKVLSKRHIEKDTLIKITDIEPNWDNEIQNARSYQKKNFF